MRWREEEGLREEKILSKGRGRGGSALERARERRERSVKNEKNVTRPSLLSLFKTLFA